MMRILVTGANGQLGSELKERSEKLSEYNFIFTDVDVLDITDEEAVEKFCVEYNPQFIINCAAYTAVDKAESDEKNARRINSFAPAILAKTAKKINAGFIHVSTDYVFNGRAFTPYKENDKVSPQSVYGRTKLEGEKRILEENKKAVILRTSWLYSSYGKNFVKTMLKLAEKQSVLKVVFDQVGTPTYAADLARAICDIVDVYKNQYGKFIPGIYHFSDEGVISWYDFAKNIFEITDCNIEVIPVLSREFKTEAKRPNYSVLDKSKIKSIFNIEIPYWRDSLKLCLDKIKI